MEMILYSIIIGLIVASFLLFRKLCILKTLNTKLLGDLQELKRDHDITIEEKNRLSENLKNFSETACRIKPSLLQIKKIVSVSKADINPLTESIQVTNNNLVSNFTSIVNQINDTMKEVMDATVATQKKIVNQSNQKVNGFEIDSALKEEDFVRTIQIQYDSLLTQIIEELMLTHHRKEEDIIRLDEIYQNVQKIQSFSEEVTEIANGIELISLNASIEAAKAGIHGKTFAVVAKEVGKMATLSEDTAKKIRKELKNTNDTIKTSISTIKEAMYVEKQYINSTVSIIKDVFQSVVESLFQLNKTLIISMGGSSEIKKSVKSTINVLQLEFISIYLNSNLTQVFEDVLTNVMAIHQIIPKLDDTESSLKDKKDTYLEEFENLDKEIQSNISLNGKIKSKDEITFF